MADREIEIRGGIRFVLQREVPPFRVEWREACVDHQRLEQQPVGLCLRGNVLKRWMRGFAEAVVAGAEFQAVVGNARCGGRSAVGQWCLVIYARNGAAQRHDGQVDGAGAAVAGVGGDIAFVEQAVLGHRCIELGLHLRGAGIGGPVYEIVDGALRAVAVVGFQREAHRQQFGFDVLQRGSGGFGKQTCGFVVAVDAAADEIVAGEVAYVELHGGDGPAEIDDVARALRLALRITGSE